MIPSTIRAVQFDSYGGPEVYRIVELPTPQPQAGEVLVEIKAAGVNPGEGKIRSGEMRQMFPVNFPSGEGSDLAGVVVALGEGVTEFAVDDEVLGYSWARSSHASHAVIPVGQLVLKPADLGWNEAGALYVAGCTAYSAVRAAGVKAGETAAVSAAAGGVGGITVQLAAFRGARVLGIASVANAEWLRAHGAIPVAYGDGLAERLRQAAPEGIDAFIDLYGPEYIDLAMELGIPVSRIETIISFQRAGEVGAKAEGSSEASTQEVLSEMAALVTDGTIDLEIAATFPLDQVADAFRLVEQGHTRGKIVLIP